MKKIFTIFVTLIINFSFSQIEKLEGKWILDKVIYKDGRNIEINHPNFSFYSIYQFNKENLLKINDSKFKVIINSKQINSDFRNFNYSFIEKFLILEEVGDLENKLFVLLRPNDFIKKYPEFTPKEELRNGKNLLVCNEVIEPNFNYEDSFQDFIIRNTPQDDSKNDNDIYFKVEYILTKDNKINYIKVLDSKNSAYDTNFIQAIKRAEKYYDNPFGRDILIQKEQKFLKWKNDLKNKDEIKLYDIRKNILQFYDKNKFDNIIKEYYKLKDINIGENRFSSFIEEINIKTGIAFLSQNNIEKACDCFKKAGDKTNFNVRNYIINFCEK